MMQQIKPAARLGLQIILAAVSGVALAVLYVASFVATDLRNPLVRTVRDSPLTDAEVSSMLAARAEAAYAREKAAKHMLEGTNFAPWL